MSTDCPAGGQCRGICGRSDVWFDGFVGVATLVLHERDVTGRGAKESKGHYATDDREERDERLLRTKGGRCLARRYSLPKVRLFKVGAGKKRIGIASRCRDEAPAPGATARFLRSMISDPRRLIGLRSAIRLVRFRVSYYHYFFLLYCAAVVVQASALFRSPLPIQRNDAERDSYDKRNRIGYSCCCLSRWGSSCPAFGLHLPIDCDCSQYG